MKICECSQCGVSATSQVWGLALLVRGGWGIATTTNPPGAAERAWLCAGCGTRAESVGRALGRLSSSAPPRERVRIDRRLRVLVVDDQVLVLRTMSRLLASFETTSVSNPTEALALVQSGAQFDVVLSDVMMPELTGPELYVQCQRHSPQLARRFLFASADPAAAQLLIADAAARIGADRPPPLLAKPASRDALLSAVNAVAASAAPDSGTYELRLPGALLPEEASDQDQQAVSADRRG